jgi:casein kinase 1
MVGLQTLTTTVSSGHPGAITPHAAHREHRRDREHGGHRRTSRPLQDGGSPSGPLVLSPTPAHIKSSNRRYADREQRERDRGTPTRDVSVQPLAPATRRGSQPQTPVPTSGNNALVAPHPYATAPNPTGYRGVGAAGVYGRHSSGGPGSHALTNGSVTALNHPHNLNGSESFLYGGGPVVPAKNSREDAANGGKDPLGLGGGRGMMMYDRDPMRGVGRQDDAHPIRRRGFFSVFCCQS